MSDQPNSIIHKLKASTYEPEKRVLGSGKGGNRPNYQLFADDKDIQPINRRDQYPESKQDTFDLCVAQCNDIGGSPGCTGCSYEVSSKRCLLYNGELNEPVSHKGWNAARRGMKSLNQGANGHTPLVVDPGNGEQVSTSLAVSSSEPAQETQLSQSSTTSISPLTVLSVLSVLNNPTANLTSASTTLLTSTTSSLNATRILSTTNPFPTSTNPTNHDSSVAEMMSHHGGTIAGMMVGCVSGVALFAWLIFLFRHRKQKRARDSQFNVLSMKKVETTAYSDQVPRQPGEYVPITAATMAALRRTGDAPKELPGSTRMPVELPDSKSKPKSTRPRAQHTAMFDIDL